MVELPELIVEDEYPLSPVQQGYLSHGLHRSERGGDLWQVVCTLNEPVETAKLLSAWESVVARHDILRTSIEWEGRPEPVQKVHRSVRLPAAVLDWRHLDSDQQRDRLASLLAEERSAGFHLNQAPLMRLAVMDCGPGQHELLCTFHCAVLDSQSVSDPDPRSLRAVRCVRGAGRLVDCRRHARIEPTSTGWVARSRTRLTRSGGGTWREYWPRRRFFSRYRAGGEEGVGSVEVSSDPRRNTAFACVRTRGQLHSPHARGWRVGPSSQPTHW